MREAEVIAAGYDAIASAYDSQLAPAQWIRERLWERMDALFPKGTHVLDVTAGTGLDAIHLMERGVRVLACDVSPSMLAQVHLKNPNIETLVLDFNQLDLNWKFDGVISTFAGLNTSADLGPFAKSAARLLRPGGVLFIHLLNRWPLADIARYFVDLQWSTLWHTISSSRREVQIGNVLVPHYLYSPSLLYRRTFAKYFRLKRLDGQGILQATDANLGIQPGHAEKRLSSSFPFHSLGIFFSIEMILV
jgi:SAM-dependent methyltransferase